MKLNVQLQGTVWSIRPHKCVSAFPKFQVHYIQSRAQRMAANSGESPMDIYGPFLVARSTKKNIYLH
jgi:hypothetical protein